MSKIMFRSEVELSKFLGSVDIIQDVYQANLETNLTYELHTTRSGIDVLAFNCSLDDYTTRFLQGEFNLVSSKELQHVNFISTKSNSSFFINKAAVDLFQDLGDDLKEVENKHINEPLIITGSGLGAYLAILSTLRLHHAIDVKESDGETKTKRPICITFGSPLVGDASLQRAIAERPRWISSFLNVVAKNDAVASFFSLNTPYKPFGTFLFSEESGGHTAFEDQDSIMQVLHAMKPKDVGNLQVYDYANVLSSIRRNALYRGVSESNEFTLNLLRAGIKLQLREVGVLDDIPNDQIGEMEEKQKDLAKSKKEDYEPTKKLNDMKIILTYLEWYMKKSKLNGGYYDSYKNAKSTKDRKAQQEILKLKRFLNQYWVDMVEEKDKMPQKEGAKLRKRWLLNSFNYRCIVESLDIAEYYQSGKTNYMENRSDHFKLLEKWYDEYKKDLETSEVVKKNMAASLTEDSCFWAHVEEALILLRKLVNGDGGSINMEKELMQFEDKVMCAIKNYSVSPDIFLEGSSFMKWWNEYKVFKGIAYASEFAQYMNKEGYISYK